MVFALWLSAKLVARDFGKSYLLKECALPQLQELGRGSCSLENAGFSPVAVRIVTTFHPNMKIMLEKGLKTSKMKKMGVFSYNWVFF